MPHLLACPVPPKCGAAETPKREAFAAELAPAPRRVVFVVRGRPGPGDRPALPPGSPESWGAITDNTLLHQAPYPFPVWPACR